MERINYSRASATWQEMEIKTKSGTTRQWRCMLRYWQDGKRKTKSKSFPPTKSLNTERKRQIALNTWIDSLEAEQDKVFEEAERIAAEKAARERAQQIASNIPTVMDCVREYIDKAKHGMAGTTDSGIEGSTILDYERTARRLEPDFSTMLITELKPLDVSKWEMKKVKEGVSKNAIGKCHRLLSAACNEAIKMQYIEVNPITAVKPPKRDKPKPNSLEQKQMREVTSWLLDMEATPLVTAAFLGLHLGLRLGEVCGLRWRDVSFEEDGLYVRQSIGTGPGGTYVKKPKSAAGERFVPFDSELTVEVLNARRKLTISELGGPSVDINDCYVLGSPAGKHPYMSPTALSKQWAALSSAWKLKGTQGRQVTFHDLRHSSVTAAIEAGGDGEAENIAANHGHSDVKMTLNVYGSSTSEGKRRSALRAGDYMRPESRPKPSHKTDGPAVGAGKDHVSTYDN